MNAVTFTRALILGTLCTPAVAASESLVFDDGGAHVIDYFVGADSVVIRNSSSVTVVAGGVTPAVELTDNGRLILDGGSIAQLSQDHATAGAATYFALLSGEVRGDFVKQGGTAEILGGRVIGEVNVVFGDLRVAGVAQIGRLSGGHGFGGPGVIRVEGGTIDSVRFGLDSFKRVELLGGTIRSLGISLDDGGTLEMRGGTVCCDLALVGFAQIFDGSIGTLLDTYHLTLYDGALTGGVHLGGIGDGRATILGGSISGPDFALRAIELSIFDVYGGTFDGAFLGYDDAIFNVFGRDLAFDGSTLTGFLADGSRIDVPVQLNSDRAAVRLFAVPEPATSTLLLLGLAWLAALNRLVHPGVHRRA